ncbi:hypothetical protein OUZ56_021995 [Daphnia magna]|uniref:Uncharacterized protein n=1 Tax=Daphnia magna TaxID=35525 RepID=A0ABR0AV13_9CRUS|nr:hypothetical protein OUZ56_021995 [Daphnia magna]
MRLISFLHKSSRNWSEEERFVLRTFINKYNKELQQVQKSTADARISAESSLLYAQPEIDVPLTTRRCRVTNAHCLDDELIKPKSVAMPTSGMCKWECSKELASTCAPVDGKRSSFQATESTRSWLSDVQML